MSIEEMLRLKDQHDSLVFRQLYNRLVLTPWRHYKGDHYYIVNVVWDAAQDEWAIHYGRPPRIPALASPMTYVRTMSNWFSCPFVGDPTPRFREVK